VVSGCIQLVESCRSMNSLPVSITHSRSGLIGLASIEIIDHRAECRQIDFNLFSHRSIIYFVE